MNADYVPAGVRKRASERAALARADLDRRLLEKTRARQHRDLALFTVRGKVFYRGARVHYTKHAIDYFAISDARVKKVKRVIRMEADGCIAVLDNRERWSIYHLEPA